MRLIFLSTLLFIFSLIGCGGDNQSSIDVSFVEEPLITGTNKKTIKSFAEITNDLGKALNGPWDAIYDERDSLGRVALDLEKYLAKPIGEFASKIVLVTKNLIMIFQSDLDMGSRENFINKTLNSAELLKYEINYAVSLIPETELFNLKFISDIGKLNEKIYKQAEEIDKNKIGFTLNYDELMEENEALLCRHKELKDASDLRKAKGLLQELIKNIKQGTLVYSADSASRV